MRGQGTRIVLDLLLQKVDAGLKLRVGPAKSGMWQVVDGDVRFHTVTLNQPALAIRAIDADFRGRGESVVGLDIAAGEPDFAAPGAGANHLAHLEMLEALAERLAVRCRLLVAEDDDMPAECVLHVPRWIANAR